MAVAAKVDSPSRWAPLADYRFALATALLILNDRVLKTEWPGLVTGKLSDFFGPVVLATILAVVLRSRSGSGAAIAAVQRSVGVVAAFMVAIKVSQPVADMVADLLAPATGANTQIIADPADLIGLSALLFVPAIISSPRVLVDRRIVRFLGLAVGLYATVATSSIDTDAHDRIGVLGGEIVAYDITTDFGDHYSAVVLRDGEWVEDIIIRGGDIPEGGQPNPYCLSSDESICVKGDGAFRVLESADGGATWRTVFDVDENEAWLTSTNFDVIVDSNSGPGEVLELDDGTLIVSMGEMNPITRSPVGAWSPTDVDVRAFPFWDWLMIAASVLGLVNGLVLVARAKGRVRLLVPGILILPCVLPWLAGAGFFWVGGEALDLLTGFLLVGGVGGWLVVAILNLIAWVEVHRTEERGLATLGITFATAMFAAALTVVPLTLWLMGVIDWPVVRVSTVALAVVLVIAAVAVAVSRRVELKPPANPAPVPGIPSGFPTTRVDGQPPAL